MIVFFRQTLLSINNVNEEKFQLQKLHISQLNNAYEGILKALTTALDYRDHNTWGHSARVVGYAVAIGDRMGLDRGQLRELAWGGFLHDIGKIGVPDAILLKKAGLTADEWDLIKKHPELGYDIVADIDFLQNASRIVLYHHEFYDGAGYPDGLMGEDIPLLARIFTIADSLDAMTSDRPYRKARTVEDAFQEITGLAGEQFCPKAVDALLEVGIENIYRIQRQVLKAGNTASIRELLSPTVEQES